LRAASSSAAQEIPLILWNPKVYYRVHNSLQLDPILRQANSVWILISYAFKIQSNVIFSSTLRSSKLSHSFSIFHKTSTCVSFPQTCHMPCPSHFLQFYHQNNIRRGLQIMKLLFMHFSQIFFLPRLSYSKMLIICSSDNMSDYVLHPCETRGRTAFLYSRYSDSLRPGRSGDRVPVWSRFSAPVLTGRGAHPASHTIGAGSFPGVKRPGLGVDHRLPLSAEVKERVELYLYPPLLAFLACSRVSFIFTFLDSKPYDKRWQQTFPEFPRA
jgi:hypothetical protein